MWSDDNKQCASDCSRFACAVVAMSWCEAASCSLKATHSANSNQNQTRLLWVDPDCVPQALVHHIGVCSLVEARHLRCLCLCLAVTAATAAAASALYV